MKKITALIFAPEIFFSAFSPEAKMPARRQHTALYIPLPAAANPENPYTEATQGWLPLPPAEWAHSGAQDKYPAGPASRSLPSF